MVPLMDSVVDTKLAIHFPIILFAFAMCFYSASHPKVESISPPLEFPLWSSSNHEIRWAFKSACVLGFASHCCSSVVLKTTLPCTCAKSLQSCLTLCEPMDCSPPGSSVLGTLQARILEWVAMPSSRGSSWPRDRTHVSCISCTAGRFFTPWATWEAPCSTLLEGK